MRVIAGKYRSRLLAAPRGLDTRPTTDRLRETLFNILAPRLEGAVFVDLYAGSGANGIEALSRGASRVFFVEQAAPALTAIRANLTSLSIRAGAVVEGRKTAAWLQAMARAAHTPSSHNKESLDIVFLDPPYDLTMDYAATLALLGGEASVLLRPDAIVVAEHRRQRLQPEPLSERYGRLTRTRTLEQGDAALSFYAMTAREEKEELPL